MPNLVNVIWGARCGESARRVLPGETRPRDHAYSVRRRRESAYDRKAPHGLPSSRLVSTNPFDLWMKRKHPQCRFSRYAEDGVVHCHSQEEAREVMQSIASRLAECGLTIHPDKSQIVYCKDSNRTQSYPHVYFTYLGFTFRPRKALNKTRRIFTSFLPGVSADALKRMRQTVRGWKLNRQTHRTLAALAMQYNPIIQGWWNYYGAFYPTAMFQIYQHLDRALARWARRKYRALSGRQRASVQWLRKMKKAEPQLFQHWTRIGSEVG